MVMVGFPEEDIMSQIDFDAFFGELPDDLSLLGAGEIATLSPDSAPLSFFDFEDLLMNDEIDGAAPASETTAKDVSDGFLADLFVDFPSDGSCEVVDGSSDKESDSGGVSDKPAEVAEPVDDSGNADGPVDKKRQRQLRNRDAAVRSRERKKEYVKDLEAKSKYMERECLRLGRLLQCLTAENQALRFGLQSGNAYVVPMANQESAVLLLESLLLGSLYWFLGIICLSTLPALPRLTLEATNAGKKDLKSRALKGARSETDRSSLSFPFIGRSCKSSKTKMKAGVLVPGSSSFVI